MPQPFRIGSQIGPYDPFWVQIREAVNQQAQQLGLYLIQIEIAGKPDTLPIDEQIGVVRHRQTTSSFQIRKGGIRKSH